MKFTPKAAPENVPEEVPEEVVLLRPDLLARPRCGTAHSREFVTRVGESIDGAAKAR